MTSDTEEISPEVYQKLVTLSELMIERNNLIEILGGIKQHHSSTRSNMVDRLENKYLVKINLIDNQMNRVAAGLHCSICHKIIALNDKVLVCQWCGSPAHTEQFKESIKREGHCPACGHYLKVRSRGGIKTITQDLLKTCVVASSKKIPQIEIFYENRLIESADTSNEANCPECKRPTEPTWKYCRYCGTSLVVKSLENDNTIICPRCARPVKASWRFCKLCGHPLHQT